MDFTGKKILFVQPPIDREDVVMPVLTTAVEILVEENMSVKRTEPLLLILEEFPLGHWRKAEQWMSFRRSNGLAVILIAQLFAQIRRRYGQDTALSILGNANTQIYFNCNDVETAKMVSDRCGYKEVRFKSDSTSTGKSGRTRSSSEQRQKVPLMTHDELLSMSEGEFVMFNLAYGAGGKSSIPIHQTYRIPEFELDRDEQLKSEGWDLIYPELCERVKPFHLDQKQRVAALLKRGEAAEKLLPLSSSPTTTPTTTTNATLQGILAKHKQDYLDYV